MDKYAYDLGVQQALVDFGIVEGHQKTAGVPELGKLFKGFSPRTAARDLFETGVTGLGDAAQRFTRMPTWQQHLMAGGLGGALGAGGGALLADDPGQGALTGGVMGGITGLGGVALGQVIRKLRANAAIERALSGGGQLENLERGLSPDMLASMATKAKPGTRGGF